MTGRLLHTDLLLRVLSHFTLSAVCSGCCHFSHFIDGDTKALRNDTSPISSGQQSWFKPGQSVPDHRVPRSTQGAPYCLAPPTHHCGLPCSPTIQPTTCSVGAGIWVQLSLGTQPMCRCVTAGVPQPVDHPLLRHADGLDTPLPKTLPVLSLASL